MTYATERTDRIDTTITLVAAYGTEGWTLRAAAAHQVESEHEGAKVLAVWRHHERNKNGWPVFAVEWEIPDE